MAHQFNSDLPFDMDNCFNIHGQPMWYPFYSTSFSSSSSYDTFNPTSGFSTPREFSALEPDGCYNNGSHGCNAVPPLTAGNFMLDSVVKMRPEQMPFPVCPPNTPVKPDLGYRDVNVGHDGSMNSLAPSSPEMFPISPDAVIGAGSFVMTPTQVSSGFETADIYSPWSCASDSPTSFLPSSDEAFEMDHQSSSPYYVTSPVQPQARLVMVNEAQHKTVQLQDAPPRRTRRRSVKADSDPADPAWRSCDYPGCNKAFRRKEHLKRHKQSFHGEGPNRFSCEFCGKGQFNRRDNLNNHRKLHARRNSHNRGVEFVADAVLVMEEERRRRAVTKRRNRDVLED